MYPIDKYITEISIHLFNSFAETIQPYLFEAI